jgi:hypothetical protein
VRPQQASMICIGHLERGNSARMLGEVVVRGREGHVVWPVLVGPLEHGSSSWTCGPQQFSIACVDHLGRGRSARTCGPQQCSMASVGRLERGCSAWVWATSV